MKINDFLTELREALEGEIPASEVNSNLRYYEDYMTQQKTAKSEEEITAQLGEPRLIARTIIDTYQMEHGGSNHYEYSVNDKEEAKQEQDINFGSRSHIYHMPSWLFKVIIILILFAVLSLVFWLGGIVLRIFFRFGIPLLLIYIGVTMVMKRRR